MVEQRYKYLIHLKAGDVIHLNGIPYELYDDADLGGNTSPEEVGLQVDFEEV